MCIRTYMDAAEGGRGTRHSLPVSAQATNCSLRITNHEHFYPTMFSSRIRRNFLKTNARCPGYPTIFRGCGMPLSRPNSTLKTGAKPHTLLHYNHLAHSIQSGVRAWVQV